MKSRTLDGPDETRWPCRAWSWSNQLLTALAAHDDARGFRQWREEGRYVREGERGFPILVPCHAKRTVRDDDKGEEREILALVGFRSCVGLEKEADPGGCWEYVNPQSRQFGCGRRSRWDLARVLGLSRLETDRVRKEHNLDAFVKTPSVFGVAGHLAGA